MILSFPVTRIQPQKDMTTKLEMLGQSPYLERILGTISLLNLDGIEILNTTAIFDTGAVLSLFPAVALPNMGNLKSVKHTMWGIINKDECRMTVDLAVVPIRLQDMSGGVSSTMKVLAGFVKEHNVPSLLGMKSFLAEATFSHKRGSRIFTIEL